MTNHLLNPYIPRYFLLGIVLLAFILPVKAEPARIIKSQAATYYEHILGQVMLLFCIFGQFMVPFFR